MNKNRSVHILHLKKRSPAFPTIIIQYRYCYRCFCLPIFPHSFQRTPPLPWNLQESSACKLGSTFCREVPAFFWCLLLRRDGCVWTVPHTNTGRCFQIFLFSTRIGEDFHFDWYFSKGLKPPTRTNCGWRTSPPQENGGIELQYMKKTIIMLCPCISSKSFPKLDFVEQTFWSVDGLWNHCSNWNANYMKLYEIICFF